MLQRSLLVALVFLCFSVTADATNALQPLTLQLKWYHQFQFAGYYAALEKGYYQEAGLDVTIREGDPKRNPILDVVEGVADFGIGASELVLARAEGKPVVALAVILQHSPLIVLARQGPQMHSFHDLLGKNIRVVPHEYELHAMFHAMGFAANDFDLTPRTPHDVDDLIDGRTEAISSYSSDESYFLEQRNIPMLQVTPRSVGIDFYGDTLFTREQLLQQSPKTVEAFRLASLNGWRYAMAHTEEIADLIKAKYAPDKGRDHLLWEAKQMRVLMMPEMVEAGYMSEGRWQHIRDSYASLNLLPGDMSLQGFIYNPNPVRDLTWLYLIAVAGFGIALLVGSISLAIFRLNRQLRASERNHRLLIDSSPFPVFVIRTDNTIAYLNDKAEAYFGVTRADILERLAPNFWVDVTQRERMYQILNREGHVSDFEAELKTDEGRHFWGYISAMLTRYDGHPAVLVSFNDINERKQMEEELRIREQHYRMLAENAFDVIWTIDLATGRYTYVSPSVERMRGYSTEEVMQQTLADVLTPSSLQQAQHAINQLMLTGELLKRHWEMEQPCKDGSVIWTDIVVTVMRDESGAPREIMGITRDITEQRRLREALTTRSVAIEAAAESVVITDGSGVIQYVNPAFERMTGYAADEVIGEKPSMLKSGVHDAAFYEGLWQTILAGEIWRGEISNRTRAGELYTEAAAIAPVIDSDGKITHFVAIKHDITARKQLEARLDYMAHFDVLTGVPNRQLLFDRLGQSLAMARRCKQQFAVLFIDLDGFKAINDSYGHEAGDTVLRSVAQRLNATLRDSDTVARVGGDEFAVLLNNLQSPDNLGPIIDKLIEVIFQPIEVDAQPCRVGASIGVSLYPDHGHEAEILLSRADSAMYQSKRNGKNRWNLFLPEANVG
jgi:diguanylate cyclase (GGDEF)-like protein/PAS domain S-box-containing protein